MRLRLGAARRALRRPQQTVIVAMVSVGVVQVPANEVVRVVAVGHGLVPAACAVLVIERVIAAVVVTGAAVGVFGRHVDRVLVAVVPVHVVQMAVV